MKVLAIRTPDGHYLEFSTIRANLDDGSEIAIDLDQAVFVELLDVAIPEPTNQPATTANGHREPNRIAISGAGGIESQETVKGMG